MYLAGKRIKECRLANNLTQADVAKCLGIGKQAVYKYETGSVTNIPLENIEKMAKLFHTTPCYLAGWDNTSVAPDQSTILKEDEKRLIVAYRGADERAKEDALNTLLSHQVEKDTLSEAE